jgi:dodecin
LRRSRRRYGAGINDRKERTMAEAATYKVVEVVGSSTDSIAEAMRAGVTRAAKTLRGIDWVEATGIRGHVEDGEIAHFQVEMKVGFRLED